QSFQRQPLLRTCRMPLITLRSSTRSLPRTSVGRCGSIRRHCSSLSQNKFARIFSTPLTAENQQPILGATHLLGFNPSHHRWLRLKSRNGKPTDKVTKPQLRLVDVRCWHSSADPTSAKEVRYRTGT